MATRQSLGEVFLGVTPKPVRSYLATTYKRSRVDFPKLVLPCVGRFADAETAVNAGYSPEDIESSDISLFSSLIGYQASAQSLAGLGIQFHEHLDPLNEFLDKPTCAGAVLLGVKLCQLKKDGAYDKPIWDEVWDNRALYITQLQDGVDKLARKLEGINYSIRDMNEHVKANMNDEQAMLYVYPPEYAKGYSKMFDTKGLITWNEPKIPEFDPKTDRAKFYDLVLNWKGLSTIALVNDDQGTFADRTVFVFEGTSRADIIATNRPEYFSREVIARGETQVAPSKIPLLPDDHIITEQSKVSFVQTKREQALYYRDLFAHKLGVSRSENYFLMLVDGYMFGVFGMFFSEVNRGQSGQVKETFGFNVPSKRYPRLNRLLMTALVSDEARRYFQSLIPNAMRQIDAFQTTCIATSPEVKANRGILTIVDRYQRPDGRYHINYKTKFHPWDFDGAVKQWLGKIEHQEKTSGKDLGLGANKAEAKKQAHPNDKPREKKIPTPEEIEAMRAAKAAKKAAEQQAGKK